MEEDLDAFLDDHGVPCNCGAVNFLGILEQPDMEVGLGKHSTTSTMYALTVKTSVIVATSMKNGTALTVGGVRYTARDFQRLDDGAFTQVNITQK